MRADDRGKAPGDVRQKRKGLHLRTDIVREGRVQWAHLPDGLQATVVVWRCSTRRFDLDAQGLDHEGDKLVNVLCHQAPMDLEEEDHHHRALNQNLEAGGGLQDRQLVLRRVPPRRGSTRILLLLLGILMRSQPTLITVLHTRHTGYLKDGLADGRKVLIGRQDIVNQGLGIWLQC